MHILDRMRKRGVRGVLIDLDGVLYDVGSPIPGAVETVSWLETRTQKADQIIAATILWIWS